MFNEIVATSANVALALSVIVAVVFGIAQVRAAERDRRERFALDALRNFQTRAFAEFIHYISTHNIPTSQKEQLALPHNEQVIFIQLAQQMESLGLLVAGNLIDISLVDRTLGSFVVTAWGKYKPFFTVLRQS